MPLSSPQSRHRMLLRVAAVPAVLGLGLTANPSRRSILVAATSAALSAPPSSSSSSSSSSAPDGGGGDDWLAVDPGLALRCRDGALAAEQAVPGAYQHECMALPVRRIPVRVSPSPAPGSAEPSNPTTILLDIAQRPAAAGTTGTAVWNGDLLLARLLERLAAAHPDWLAGRTVLELGCGAGLVALAAAVLGAVAVVATDGNPAVVDLARDNAAANALSGTVAARSLRWGLLDALEVAGAADLVLGADLTYSPGSWRALAETMETVLADRGVVLYLSLGHSGFNVEAEVEGFLSVAQQQGLEVIDHTSAEWPFPMFTRPLSTVALEGITSREAEIVQAAGGVKVVVLRRKTSRRL